MTSQWKHIVRTLGLGIALAWCLPAQATVTLDLWFTDLACSVTHNGITTGVPCTPAATGGSSSQVNAGSVTATLGPGDSERIDAILHYTYSDQGLPVPSFVTVQMDASGLLVMPLSFEAGAILVRSQLCQGRYCAPPTYPTQGTGTPMFPPILLGVNDRPDQLSGQVSVFSGYEVAPSSGGGSGSTLTASLSAMPQTFGGVGVPVVTAIPEPSTWALMLLGLGLVGAASRRRLARAHPHQ